MYSSRANCINDNVVLTRKRLDDLVREVDPHEQLDDDVKDFLLETTDAFIDGVMQDACRLAKHRGSDHVDASDLLLVLEKNHNMWIPGFSRDQAKPYKKAHTTEAHRQRLALIRKAMKKV